MIVIMTQSKLKELIREAKREAYDEAVASVEKDRKKSEQYIREEWRELAATRDAIEKIAEAKVVEALKKSSFLEEFKESVNNAALELFDEAERIARKQEEVLAGQS